MLSLLAYQPDREFKALWVPQVEFESQAAKKQVIEWTPADLGLDAAQIGAAGARVTMEALFQPKNETEVELIEADLPVRNDSHTLITQIESPLEVAVEPLPDPVASGGT